MLLQIEDQGARWTTMGIDLYAFPERFVDGRYQTDLEDMFFHWRDRDLWAFLGGWKSEVGIPPIAEARGVPPDGLRDKPFDDGLRAELDGASWVSVRELLEFDYDATFVGTFRITAKFGDLAVHCEADPEATTEITFRRFLGSGFFDELARFAASGAERLVFFYR